MFEPGVFGDVLGECAHSSEVIDRVQGRDHYSQVPGDRGLQGEQGDERCRVLSCIVVIWSPWAMTRSARAGFVWCSAVEAVVIIWVTSRVIVARSVISSSSSVWKVARMTFICRVR